MRRGLSLMEVVLGLALTSMVMAGTAALLNVGRLQQRAARDYSQAQTDLRDALRRATRTIRHGYAVMNPSAAAFPGSASDAGQVIVQVPEPTGVTPPKTEIRIYTLNGVLYAQRADQPAPGTALARGVRAFSAGYFRSVGAVRTAVDDAPQTANEVQLTMTLGVGGTDVTASTEVALRNTPALY